MDQILGEYLPIASSIVALLAFIVSLITETIKNLAFLKKNSNEPSCFNDCNYHLSNNLLCCSFVL